MCNVTKHNVMMASVIEIVLVQQIAESLTCHGRRLPIAVLRWTVLDTFGFFYHRVLITFVKESLLETKDWGGVSRGRSPPRRISS